MGRKDIGTLAKQANEARNKILTPKQRSQIASKAAKARWAKHNEIRDHVCTACICTCGVKKWRHDHKNHEFQCTKFI